VAFFAVHDDKLMRGASADACGSLIDYEAMFVVAVVQIASFFRATFV
jgi:hypothetical protein